MHLLLLFIPNNTVPDSIHGPFSRGRSFRRAPLAAGPLPLRGRLCNAHPHRSLSHSRRDLPKSTFFKNW